MTAEHEGSDDSVTTTSFVLVVNNVASDLGAITASLDTVPINAQINVSSSFTDLGFDNPPGSTVEDFTAVILWGDGTNSDTTDGTGNITVIEIPGGIGQPTTGTIQASHAYSTPGVYTLTLTVTDDDGGSDQSTFEYVAVYDPGSGFVTVGGWINSPLGACTLTVECETETNVE